MTTIYCLPPELLVEIFVYCASNPGQFTLVVVSQVCRHWRDVCLASPRPWRHIIIRDKDRSIFSIKNQAEMWIAHSDPLQFTVHIFLSDFNRLLSILSCFFPYLCRWSDCSISFRGRTSHTSLAELTLAAPRRVLHHLELRLKVPFDTDGDDDKNIFFPCGSSSFRHISMKMVTSYLPCVDLINPLYFTSIDITEFSFSHTIRSSELLCFLSRCYNLEHFYLHGVSYEEGILAVSPITVTLPHLHTLLLDLICIQRSVLSHLHLPALKELHLRHLNMDVSLEGYHLQENGDSDDEAHDFSQSPSSDHHTGMGLRKFILSSSPPLEVLDMDLSDMRTKDFRWVFDRLPYLKHFSITGSDMSDKVVQLFKPELIQPRPDTPHRYRVRLPQLTSLKLSGCQQFSGEAVVDALSARVLYTDMVTPDETLTNVVVSGCQNFTPSHGIQLSWYLHERLHFS